LRGFIAAAYRLMRPLPLRKKQMNRQRLTTAALMTALSKLNGWTGDEAAIQKHFVFADFSEAFAFLTRIAMLSEKMDHHAAWSGVYNKVDIRLSTHDAGGVTEWDIAMATAIEGFLK